MNAGRGKWLSLGLITALLLLTAGPTVAEQEYLSPQALVADSQGKTLYIVESTAGRVAQFDLADGKVRRTIDVGGNLSDIAIAPNDKLLFVTVAEPQGKLIVINAQSGKVRLTINVGHSPCSVTVSPNGSVLYVCNQFNNEIAIVSLSREDVVGRIKVLREPVAAAVTGDARTLFVANHLSAGAADGEYSAAAVSVVNVESFTLVKTIALPNGSHSLRDICVSPDGKFVYVTHILGRFQVPASQLIRGWINTNVMSVIDVEKQVWVNTVILDDVDLGAANPWGVECSGDGKYICVSHAGTHEISIIDRNALHSKLDRVAAGEKVSDVSMSAEDVQNDLSFMYGLRRRIKLPGNGPRGIAIVGNKVYAAEYFSDSLAIADLDADAFTKGSSIALGPKKKLSEVRKGKKNFNDAEMCFQKWQSCASCHPGDARNDALNWDLLNDGIGNPKNTKSLLLAHATPPAMITGIRASAEVAVRAGMRHIQFAVYEEENVAAIDEYLKSLKPVPSPYLRNAKLSRAAVRGKKVFKETGCSSCHSGKLLTDMQKYDVGTGKGREEGLEFDTPTLVEIWRSAPYLNDGRATTIEEVIARFNPDDKHGTTSNLTKNRIKDLTEFILSQ